MGSQSSYIIIIWRKKIKIFSLIWWLLPQVDINYQLFYLFMPAKNIALNQIQLSLFLNDNNNTRQCSLSIKLYLAEIKKILSWKRK